MVKKLALFGPNSVGKGYCMKVLAGELSQASQIKLGDYFRFMQANDDDFKKKFGGIMDKGDLIPCEDTIEHVDNLITSTQLTITDKPNALLVLDGLFRTPLQIMRGYRLNHIGSNDTVCILRASPETCRTRHKDRMDRKPDGARHDDKWFEKRLKDYNDSLPSVVKAFNKTGACIRYINANHELGKVAQDVVAFARQMLGKPANEPKVGPRPYLRFQTETQPQS